MKTLTLLIGMMVCLSGYPQNAKNKFIGEYQIQPGVNVEITGDESGYTVQIPGQPAEKLVKQSKFLYAIESIGGTVDFSLLDSRDVLKVGLNGRLIHAPRIPVTEQSGEKKEIDLTVTEDMGFTGQYSLDKNLTFTVSLREGKLFIQLTGQQEFEVYPFDKNKFFYKVVDAWVEFIKGSDGQVDYLLLHQSGAILEADKL
jgi:hypothetical protein